MQGNRQGRYFSCHPGSSLRLASELEQSDLPVRMPFSEWQRQRRLEPQPRRFCGALGAMQCGTVLTPGSPPRRSAAACAATAACLRSAHRQYFSKQGYLGPHAL